MAGIQLQAPAGKRYDWQGNLQDAPVGPNPSVFGDPNAYTGAAAKQNNDYDSIMNNYKQMFNAPASTPISYTGSPDVTSAMGNLKELSTTGGYSDQNINDIRARGVSPIRSIYASAQRNLERQRSLQGGYSPNMAAATTKMAREQSDLISGKTTDINAGIAEAINRNRLAASSPYASLAEGEAGRGLDVSKFNTELGQQDRSRQMQAIEGMRGMFGTTPALIDMFGRQVASAASLGQNQQEINNRRRQGDVQSLASLGRM